MIGVAEVILEQSTDTPPFEKVGVGAKMLLLAIIAFILLASVAAIVLLGQTWLVVPLTVFFVVASLLFAACLAWRVRKSFRARQADNAVQGEGADDGSCPKLVFDQGISEEEFRAMAYEEAERLPRFKSLREFDGNVVVSLRSVTGKTRWSFGVDFNDFGELSGRYWLHTENDDSSIPKEYAERLKKRITYRLVHPRDEADALSSPPMMWDER